MGSWIQDSKGSKGPKGPKGRRNSYTVDASGQTDTEYFGTAFIELDQSGGVTPAGGYLQLIADSTLIVNHEDEYQLVSIGREDADCVATHFSF